MVIREGKLWVHFGGWGRGHAGEENWTGYWRIYDEPPTSNVVAIEIGFCLERRDNPMRAADDGKAAGVARAKAIQAERAQ